MKWIAGLVLAALYIALGALAMRRLGLFLERHSLQKKEEA